VRVGSMVRIELHGRRVGGWVVADGVEPVAGVKLRPVAKVTGWGPDPELFELARWAVWRWAGRQATFLGTASPERAVVDLPDPASGQRSVTPVGSGEMNLLIRDVLGRGSDAGPVALRLPPSADVMPLVVAAVGAGPTLVLAPSHAAAQRLGSRLGRAGLSVALMSKDWSRARAGCDVVIGARAAAWAPVASMAAAIVLDEHDEVYQEERAPTWHARDVVIERARRAGARTILVSPTPTLEALAQGELVAPSRRFERSGWPVVDTVDLRREDPVKGLLTERLTAALRSDARVVCVLNRKGRSRLLACASCRELARCEQCDSSVTQDSEKQLVCRRCGTGRPTVCQRCGAVKMKNLQVGVSRLREELEALAGTPVGEVTGGHTPGSDLSSTRILIGTEAVLHQVQRADVVAYLDLDQELLAPRARASEQALALLVRGARLVGGRATGRDDHGGGRLLIQTRLPRHEVVQAAVLGDPTRVSDAERQRREVLRYPPFAALAAVSGAAAPQFIESLGSPLGLEVLGPSDGTWLLRAPEHRTLCDAIASTPRPSGRLRIEVDPLRI